VTQSCKPLLSKNPETQESEFKRSSLNCVWETMSDCMQVRQQKAMTGWCPQREKGKGAQPQSDRNSDRPRGRDVTTVSLGDADSRRVVLSIGNRLGGIVRDRFRKFWCWVVRFLAFGWVMTDFFESVEPFQRTIRRTADNKRFRSVRPT